MEKVKQIISDIRTYTIMTQNENYYERLLEAYQYIQKMGLDNLEKFKTAKDNQVGAFTFDEITIFERLKNNQYKEIIASALFDINNSLEESINNSHLGDDLASWGTLGYTPKREELIQKGNIIEGLTKEETSKHYR